jgi:tellurite resistance protein TerB
MLGFLKKAAKSVAVEAKAVLEATCAAAALVAAADGDIEDAERQKMVKLITNHSTLGVLYKSNDIEACADKSFKLAKEASGRQQLARELDDLKKIEGGAQMAEDVYLLACDIAMADGELEAEEEAVLKKLANRLGVDLSKFEF